MKRWLASIFGLVAAAIPAAAMATEETRALERSGDWVSVLLVTGLGLLALGLVASVGYLYRRERKLDWDFQKPDAPDHH